MYYEATFSSADNMWRFYFLLTILDFLAFSVITSAWVNLKGYSGLVIKSCSAMLMLTSFLSLVETYYNISSNTLSDIIYKVVTPLSHILIIANLCKKGAVCGNGLYNSSSSRDGFGNKSSQDNNKGVP
jgi:hypothetical protein